MRPMLRLLFPCVFAVFMAACGFQLRGAYSLPYESIYIATGDGVIGAGLKRNIRSSGGTRLAESAAEAQATFLPTGELRDSVILSLSSGGRVREKRLRYRYAYRIVDAKGRDLRPVLCRAEPRHFLCRFGHAGEDAGRGSVSEIWRTIQNS